MFLYLVVFLLEVGFQLPLAASFALWKSMIEEILKQVVSLGWFLEVLHLGCFCMLPTVTVTICYITLCCVTFVLVTVTFANKHGKVQTRPGR